MSLEKLGLKHATSVVLRKKISHGTSRLIFDVLLSQDTSIYWINYVQWKNPRIDEYQYSLIYNPEIKQNNAALRIKLCSKVHCVCDCNMQGWWRRWESESKIASSLMSFSRAKKNEREKLYGRTSKKTKNGRGRLWVVFEVHVHA